MKKIFLIILYFICINKIYAFELSYSEWSEEYPQGVDEILIQSEDRYLWYKDDIYDIEYLIKEKIGDKLYDENDIEYYESEELDYKPEEYSEREINSFVRQVIYTKGDIAGIMVNTESENMSISEITLVKNGTEFIHFNTEFSFLNDGVLDEYHPLDRKLYLYFDRKYDIDEFNDVYISVYYNKNTSGYEQINFNFIADTNAVIYYVEYGVTLCQVQNCTLNPNKSVIRENFYHDKSVYTYKDKLYKTYRMNRDITDEYLAYKEGYEKDLDSEKTFYRYITNEYIIVDSLGNIVTDDHYCDKSFCKIIFLKNEVINNDEPDPEDDPTLEPAVIDDVIDEEEIIDNPNTYDPLYDFIVLFIISGISLTYFIVEKCRTIKKSKNVESI